MFNKIAEVQKDRKTDRQSTERKKNRKRGKRKVKRAGRAGRHKDKGRKTNGKKDKCKEIQMDRNTYGQI